MVIKVGGSKVTKATCLKKNLVTEKTMVNHHGDQVLTCVSESKVSMCTTASQWLLHTSQLRMTKPMTSTS